MSSVTARARFLIGLAVLWAVTFLVLRQYADFLRESPARYENPPCAGRIPWGFGIPVVGIVLLGGGTGVYSLLFRRFRERVLLPAVCAAVWVVALGMMVRIGARGSTRDEQSCANCRNFTHFAIDAYAERHEGWYPRGGIDEWDSLARAITTVGDVHLFTSHALSGEAEAGWTGSGSLTDALCCYRYNEGLRADDPSGLILMYYETPGRWACCCMDAGREVRACWRLDGSGSLWRWDVLDEPEFQRVQQETRRYLESRTANDTALHDLGQTLRLVLDRTSVDSQTFRLSARIVNEGAEPLDVILEDKCVVVHVNGGGSGSTSGVFWSDAPVPRLRGGESFLLEGSYEGSFTGSRSAAGPCTGVFRYKYASGSGSSTVSCLPAALEEEAFQKHYLEARVWVRVTTPDGTELKSTLNSSRVYYLAE